MEKLIKEIKNIISKSQIPEDQIHSENTLKWLLNLYPNADIAMRIAAMGHDIERAINDKKIKRRNFKTYKEFKDAHSLNSAIILENLMNRYNIDSNIIKKTYQLVLNHEFGGNELANVLKNADTLSFFEVNLPFYYKRNNISEIKRRFIWGYKKLPNHLKKYVGSFTYKNKNLNSLVEIWINQ